MNAPTPQHLSDLQRLYDAGQFVTAYRQAEAIAPLCQWRGTEARVLAARMARSVGARRSGDAYACRAFREAPRAARAFIHAAYSHLSRFGPLRTWEFLNTHEAQIDKYEPEDLRDRMLLRCQILAMMRDFVSAEQFLQDARRLDVKDSYWFVVAASMRIYQGEHDEAVQLGRQCLKEHPWYYPAVQLAAAELALQSRMPEAVELLEQAVNHIDTPLLWQQLAAYYMNANRLDDSLKAIDAMEACCPHSDREMINSLRFCRYDLLYRKNDRHAAAAELEQMQLGPAKSRTREQIERMLSRIRDDRSTSRRVQLEVPFIHQQYDTCAPTTLAMLCAYWGRPTDHRAIAAEVCYGGTPGFRQRQWAVENGWNAREFTLTENVAVQLVDRGVPFALTTSDPDSGHLMAVAGYDTCRETLIIRDPRQPLLADYPLADLLKRYADTGPLCLVIWPDHSNHLLQDLPLPDADILDKWHQVQVALDRHQREDAHRLVEEMAATHGDHRAVLYARLSISGYDLDAAAQIATVDKLLQAYPDSTLLALHKIHRLKDVARPAHRMELLEELARRPETHPGVWTQLATELLADARQHGRGRNLLRRALRCNPGDATACWALGELLWQQGQYEAGLQMYRFALCLRDTDECLVRSFFLAARHLRRTDEALANLTDRFTRFGTKSAGPAISLFFAKAMLERLNDAFVDLEHAISLRPEDGELALFAAVQHAAYGRFDRADEFLSRAQGTSRQVAVLRAAAQVEAYRHNFARSAELWAQVCKPNPQDAEAIASAARMRAQAESPDAAVEFLRELATCYPHNTAILQQIFIWLPPEQIDQRLQAINQLLDRDPGNVEAIHNKIMLLLELCKYQEAADLARQSRALTPETREQMYIEGLILQAAGKHDAARKYFQRSLLKSIDSPAAIHGLLVSCISSQEQRDALAFIEQLLVAKAVTCEGLETYCARARSEITPDALLKSLENIHRSHPHVWRTHGVLIHQYLLTQRRNIALQCAIAATERFPLVGQLWLDLAYVYQACGQQDQELAATQKALEVMPGAWQGIGALLAIHERNNDLNGVEREALRGIACEPLRCEPYIALAELRLKQGRMTESQELLQKALELDHHSDWAWAILRQWAEQARQPDAPLLAARELMTRHNQDAALRLRVATMLDKPHQQHERMNLLDDIIRKHPYMVEAYVQKMWALVDAGKIDDARKCLGSMNWGSQLPLRLRLCAAELLMVERKFQLAREHLARLEKASPQSVDIQMLKARCAEAETDAALYLEAHKAAFRLDPLNPVLAAALANAFMVNNLKKEAKELLKQTTYAAPTYLYAHLVLLDVMLDEGDFDGLNWLIERLRTHFPPAFAHSAATQAAVLRNDTEQAMISFRALLECQPTEDVLQPALRCMVEKQEIAPHVDRALLKAVTDDSPQFLATAWANHFASRRSFAEILEILDNAGSRGRMLRLLRGYFEVYGYAPPHNNKVRALVDRHASLARTDNSLWASVIHAYLKDSQAAEASKWAGNWRDRGLNEPWMLLAVVALSIEVDDLAAAEEANLLALAMPPDFSVPSHLAVRAWFTSREPSTAAECRRQLAQIDRNALAEVYQLTYDMADCVSDAMLSSPAMRRAAAGNSHRNLKAVWARWTYKQDMLALTLRRYSIQTLTSHQSWIEKVLRSHGLQIGGSVLGLAILIVSIVLGNSRSPNRHSEPRNAPAPYHAPERPRVYDHPSGQPSVVPPGMMIDPQTGQMVTAPPGTIINPRTGTPLNSPGNPPGNSTNRNLAPSAPRQPSRVSPPSAPRPGPQPPSRPTAPAGPRPFGR